MKKYIKILTLFCLISLAFCGGYFLRQQKEIIGKRSSYGVLGIYNATPITLEDEAASAIAIDSYGRPILSSTTTISIITP